MKKVKAPPQLEVATGGPASVSPEATRTERGVRVGRHAVTVSMDSEAEHHWHGVQLQVAVQVDVQRS